MVYVHIDGREIHVGGPLKHVVIHRIAIGASFELLFISLLRVIAKVRRAANLGRTMTKLLGRHRMSQLLAQHALDRRS